MSDGRRHGYGDGGRKRATAEVEETLTAVEQTLSDVDQTHADGDQTATDADQASADLDQAAADLDQAASDRDFAAGGSPAVHAATSDLRDHSMRQREHATGDRVERARRRDHTGRVRDLAALARDQAAKARDWSLEQLDAAVRQCLEAKPATDRAKDVRLRAARHRAEAAQHRVLAARDREAAAADREAAASERRQALDDCEAFTRQLAVAETDQLTGVRTRAAGLLDLGHEIDRCRRTATPLVVAYLDVVGLKAVNDAQGHRAGDELLRRVVGAVVGHLRVYDLVIRIGGDEFLCVMSDTHPEEARSRFDAIADALAAMPEPSSIRTGFAALTAGETAAQLVGRADDELVAGREAVGGGRG